MDELPAVAGDPGREPDDGHSRKGIWREFLAALRGLAFRSKMGTVLKPGTGAGKVKDGRLLLVTR